MNINLSTRFTRAYKRLPSHIQDDFDKKITIFIKNPHHSSLKAHKLKGKYQTCLSFRLRDGYRVLFEFSAPDTVDLLDIGSHDLYKKR
ncbi:type II toxin-antitoxin system RelE/ParE family toxin [Patescibacteria group bacterium]|nr:type II toxin-antitoxin system RelE/ParE family toxin [Patescibacteria group bacterium]MBU2509610.1 type II toxin-antitoxin system RelE/ParE family toxin [Patescibacteria group bacterium]